ncbi:MAG: hypothetical protein H0S85_06125 [Desulfovibrionaceae bacterium]|jgi:hypothetical protein|nr:hypothetical protein [Desulfovibrionaceae bacterium]
MGYAIDSTSLPTATQTTGTGGSRYAGQYGRSGAAASSADTVSISSAAKEKLAALRASSSVSASSSSASSAASADGDTDATKSLWESRLGLTNGTTTLADGTRRVVSIEDGHLEVQEYLGSRLTRTITGDVAGSGFVLDAEIYDEDGRVSQVVHTEVSHLEEKTAVMKRNIQWMDGDTLTREMYESMSLTSETDPVPDLGGLLTSAMGEAATEDGPGLAAISPMSLDENILSYSASIQEYAGGVLRMDTSIERNSKYSNETNHSDHEVAGRPGKSTTELAHSTGLIVNTREYDASGQLIRTVNFEDDQKDSNAPEGGVLRQSLNVSWYSHGELVKQSSGSLTLKETKESKLDERPSLLDMLGVEQDDYAAATRGDEQGIMDAMGLDGALDVGRFNRAERRGIAKGKYNAAEKIADYGARDQPYSITWRNEIFADGEMVASQEDSESAVPNPFARGPGFRVGGGLTEDLQPPTLRRTSHTDTSYEDGRVRRQGTVTSREFVEEDEDGPDRLKTVTTGELTGDTERRSATRVLDGGLGAHDAEAHKAARSMGLEMDLALHDLYETLGPTV